jgi:hypothetical protein
MFCPWSVIIYWRHWKLDWLDQWLDKSVPGTSYVTHTFAFLSPTKRMREHFGSETISEDILRNLRSLQYFRRDLIRNYVEKTEAEEQPRGVGTVALLRGRGGGICVWLTPEIIWSDSIFIPTLLSSTSFISKPLTYLTPRYFCIERMSSFSFQFI